MPRYSARRSGAASRYAAEGDAKTGSSGVERAATVAAAALGLVGYLYALGGIVLWLRVQTAQLPPDGAIVAVDPKHLLAVGARVVAFELFLLLAVSAIVTGLVAFAIVRRGGGPLTRPSQERFRALAVAWNDKTTLSGFIGPGLGLLLLATGLSVHDRGTLSLALVIGSALLLTLTFAAMVFRVPPRNHEERLRRAWRWSLRRWRAPLAKLGEETEVETLKTVAAVLLVVATVTGVVLLPILQGTLLLAATGLVYLGPLLRWPGTSSFGTFRRELLTSSGVWAAIAASTAVALAWVATPPVAFTRAVVEPLQESTPVSGAYLNRGDSGVYLGICEPTADSAGDPESSNAHIRLVPPEESAQLKLLDEAYEFDPGGRPSILQAVAGVIGAGEVATKDAPLHHALRGRAERPCE